MHQSFFDITFGLSQKLFECPFTLYNLSSTTTHTFTASITHKTIEHSHFLQRVNFLFCACADGAKQPLLTLKLICDSYCHNMCNYVENLMMHIAGAIFSSVLHPENL